MRSPFLPSLSQFETNSIRPPAGPLTARLLSFRLILLQPRSNFGLIQQTASLNIELLEAVEQVGLTKRAAINPVAGDAANVNIGGDDRTFLTQSVVWDNLGQDRCRPAAPYASRH